MSRKKEIKELARTLSKADATDILDDDQKRRKAKSCDTRLQGKKEFDPYAISKRYGNKIRTTYLDIPKEKWDKIFGQKTKQKSDN